MNSDSMDRLGKRAFCNTYKCMQLTNICVLYETFDFDEQKVKDVTLEFEKHDNQDSRNGTADVWACTLKKEYNMDCKKLSVGMPHNQKLKLAMVPKGVHDALRVNHMILNVEQAVYTYFSIMMWTLKEFCGFGINDFEKYVDGFFGICKLFSKGMTSEWMVKYIESEIGWKFEDFEDADE